MTAPKLVTSNLCKVYSKSGTNLEVLRDVSLSVADGEFVSIVGASGCGKTTLLRLVDGLIPSSSGTVSIDGRVVTSPGKDIAFVFQQDGLFPWRTVFSNAALGPEIQGRRRKDYVPLVQRILALVGLKGFEEHYPHEISGGMRQRVNIARALAIGTDVLLMDEPFAALDAQTRIIMQGELTRIWRETGKTVLFVTHQIDEAVYLSDRVVVLTARPGRIKEVVDVTLPRPRELSVKWTAEFVEYTNRIWSSIEEEVKESIGMELKAGN